MNDTIYKCLLKAEMQAFLGEVLAKGYQAKHIRSVLKEFDEFMVTHYKSMKTVTLDMYDEWFETMCYVNLDIICGSQPLGSPSVCPPLSRFPHSSGWLARISLRP